MTPPIAPSSRAGMGSIPYSGGATFRVWAPHAERVAVAGTFNDWSADAAPLASEGNGYWSADIDGVQAGQEYKYVLTSGDREIKRLDPYAREISASSGNSMVYTGRFRLGGRLVQHAALERAGDLRDAYRHVQRYCRAASRAT